MRMNKAITLRVIRLTFDNGNDETGQIVWIHLVIPIHFDHNLGAKLKRHSITTQHCSTYALIYLVPYKAYTFRSNSLNFGYGVIRAAIINDNDFAHIIGNIV